MGATGAGPDADAGLTPPRALEEAVHAWHGLVDSHRYFEAHEVVEEFWLGAAGGRDRDLARGLIHLAAALLHAQRGNRHGALVKLTSGAALLQGAHHPAGPISGCESALAAARIGVYLGSYAKKGSHFG